ncbi:MAG: Rpn family recombination-promoting nuclease/putative transposase [Peptococcaceae bacterium]|jgi:predicted transposase/invertase (TIGR01784 family)|nr:Rpn family recombination-promoting nuclease/putative transposase [Peptococcaceae bacterium]
MGDEEKMNVIELDSDGLPKILPAYDDAIFKAMLTHADALPARVDILTAFLNRNVKSATVKNVELPSKDTQVKQEKFDVNCAIDDGSQIAVEMQANSMAGDNAANRHVNIRNRSVYGLCDLHSSQPGRGIAYASFVRSYQITICGYSIFEGTHDLVETFTLRNRRGKELTDAITAMFMDLSMSPSIIKKSVADMIAAEMWAVFLAGANKPAYQKIIQDITSKREGIAVANEILEAISQNAEERARYHSRKMWAQDREHDLAIARNEGHKEGVQELAELIQKGYSVNEALDIISKK